MNKKTIIATAICYSSFVTPTYAQNENKTTKEKSHKEHQDKKGHDHEEEDGYEHGKNKNKKKKHEHKSEEKHEEGEDDEEHEGSHEDRADESKKSAASTDDHSEKDGHAHDEAVKATADAHKDHAEDEGKHGDEHGDEHGEANSKVGPNKGILEANEDTGFKLSPEALKNFEIKTIKLSSSGPWDVPLKARMLSQNEVNIYRVRNGLMKRIDFNLLSKTSDSMKVLSKDLKEGDEVIVHGIGFIRIAELAAFGGAPEGHSH